MTVTPGPWKPRLVADNEPPPGFCRTCDQPLYHDGECVNCDRPGGDCA